jgi:addiction module HigA family antidote
MKRMLPPVHPGLLLAEQLEHLKLKIQPTAQILGISRQQLHRVITGSAAISPDLAARLGHVFGNGARIWVGMQADYDAWNAEARLAKELKKIPVLV